MNTRTYNRITRTFALTAALFLGSGSVFAATNDAQDQARSMLTGKRVSFPVASDTTRVDPQTQAQWLFAGKPRPIAGAVSKESQTAQAGGAAPSDYARWLLAGKGS